MSDLATKFPRLMAIHKAYKGGDETNMLSRIAYELEKAPESYEVYEGLLSNLSQNDFEYFKSKILAYGEQHKLRGYQQFSNIFNELRGYAYLQDQGYDHVELIKEQQSRRTPDVGVYEDNNIVCALEVKTINVSDEDYKMWNKIWQTGRVKIGIVPYGIPDGLKNKIQNAIKDAKVQLLEFAQVQNARKIVFLVVKMDIKYAMRTRCWEELRDFLNVLSKSEKDIDMDWECIGFGKNARNGLKEGS